MSELARRKGVTRQAVSFACQPDGPLAGARRGRRIDAADPLVAGWLAEPERGPDSLATEGDSTGAPTKAEMMRARKRKVDAETRRIELANQITEGKVISRDFVRTHLFGLIDGAFRRLLTDVPQTVATKCFGISRSSSPSLEEAKIMTRETISSVLARIKSEARRKLDLADASDVQVSIPPPKKRKRARTRRR